MYNNPYKAYQKTQVTTASKEKILLMLYEGCIRFIKQARLYMQEKKVADKGKMISKALAIMAELNETLDHKVGGQLAADLESLYIFMMDKLIDANIHNSIEDLDVVEKLMTTLYSAWEDVILHPRPDGMPSEKYQKDLHDQIYLKAG